MSTTDVEIKQEVLSPLPLPKFRIDVDDDKCKSLNVVDKWRARVLFCQPKSNGDNNDWSKKIERQMAILRVAFPFLTERQIRGKAWKNCGLNSVMGGVPRNGLSPQVKKEFMKHQNHNRSNMTPQRSKVKKNLIRIGKDENIEYLYAFSSPNANLLTPPSTLNSKIVPNPLSSSHSNTSQLSDTQVVTPSTWESEKKRKRQKMSSDNSTNCKKFKENVIIPETPECSYNIQSPYCTQLLRPTKIETILPSLNAGSNCFTQAHITPSSTQSDSRKKALTNERIYTRSSQVINPFSQNISINNSYDKEMQILNKNTNFGISQKKNHTLVISDTSTSNHSKEMQILNKNLSFEKSQNTPVIFDKPTSNSSESLNNRVENLSFKSAHHLSNDQNINGNPSSQSNLSFSNFKNNLISQNQMNLSQENHTTVSGLANTPNTDDTVLLNLDNNTISGNTTPIRNSKIDNVRKRIAFETVAEVYVNGTNLIKKNNILNSSMIPINYDQTPSKINQEPVMKTDLHLVNSNQLIPFTNISLNLYEERTPVDVQILNSEIQENNSNNSTNNKSNDENNINFDMDVISLPSTPYESKICSLLPVALLSNYCNEHEKAYSKKDLEPNNSNEVIQSLKGDFHQVIPSEQSLKMFFEAPDKTFEQVTVDVQESVDNILHNLKANSSQ